MVPRTFTYNSTLRLLYQALKHVYYQVTAYNIVIKFIPCKNYLLDIFLKLLGFQVTVNPLCPDGKNWQSYILLPSVMAANPLYQQVSLGNHHFTEKIPWDQRLLCLSFPHFSIRRICAGGIFQFLFKIHLSILLLKCSDFNVGESSFYSKFLILFQTLMGIEIL